VRSVPALPLPREDRALTGLGPLFVGLDSGPATCRAEGAACSLGLGGASKGGDFSPVLQPLVRLLESQQASGRTVAGGEAPDFDSNVRHLELGSAVVERTALIVRGGVPGSVPPRNSHALGYRRPRSSW